MANDDRLAQLRARLISLREQRNRMAHRSTDLERRAAAQVQAARRDLDEARAALTSARAEVADRQAQLQSFERAVSVPAGEGDWEKAWRRAEEGLREAQARREALDGRAADAELTLARAVHEQEAVSAEHARAVSELAAEIDLHLREISDVQSSQPLPDAPDPRFREALLERLQHLDDERAWVSEEISIREERLRRITTESTHIRSLLDLHTPEWGRGALQILSAEPASERSAPAWRPAVIDILTQAGEPMHYRDIAAALAKLGQGLAGQDPAETLLAALSRDHDFERAARGVYWLTGRPTPASWRPRGVERA